MAFALVQRSKLATSKLENSESQQVSVPLYQKPLSQSLINPKKSFLVLEKIILVSGKLYLYYFEEFEWN